MTGVTGESVGTRKQEDYRGILGKTRKAFR